MNIAISDTASSVVRLLFPFLFLFLEHFRHCSSVLRRTLRRRAALCLGIFLLRTRHLGDAEYGHVEYWARQEWKHIEAHADVDEKAAAAGGALRYPTTGHVLYLRVGSEVRGPTCVWSDRALARGALTTVPAVAGRVLRFDGAATHAVPRPHDLWFLPFVKSGGRGDAFERSVVLFNTWPYSASPSSARKDDSACSIGAFGASAAKHAWPSPPATAASWHRPSARALKTLS